MLAIRRFHPDPARLRRRLHPAHLAQLPHLIRFRLTLWYTGLAALVLAGFVASIFFAFKQYHFDNFDDKIYSILSATFDQQVLQVPKSARPPGSYGFYAYPDEQPQPPQLKLKDGRAPSKVGDYYMYFFLPNGQPLSQTPMGGGSPLGNAPAKAARKVAVNTSHKTETTVNGRGGPYRVTTVPLEFAGRQVYGQIAAPLHDVQRQVDSLKWTLVYIAGVLLIISAIGGWILSGRALKPVDEITRRAQQITANDLSQRLDIKQEDELGRMASTFDDMIARLEEAFERQKRFASDASHELRTPLTVMQSEVSLALARPRSRDEYRETLASVDEEVSRLTTIVGDLLTLTRIDVDPAGIQHKPVALDELLRTLAARVNVIAAERDIAVRAENLAPVTVTGDSTRLRQLFTNLLDNAVNYTPDGGRVTVTLDKTGDGARARVVDTGIGIAPTDLPRIFERFYRSDAAREQNAHGTGLGLAISRSVVQAHHGHITVVSEQGKGTTFTVTLPSDSRKLVRRVFPWRAPALAHVDSR